MTVESLRTDLHPIRKHLGFGFKPRFQPHDRQPFAVAKSHDRYLHETNHLYCDKWTWILAMSLVLLSTTFCNDSYIIFFDICERAGL